MTDDDDELPKLPKLRNLTAEEIEQVVLVLMARLDHLLKREAKVGTSTPNRLEPKGSAKNAIKPDRVKEEEFTGRLVRLIDHLDDVGSMFYPLETLLAALLEPSNPESPLGLEPGEVTALWDGGTLRSVRETEVAEFLADIKSLRRRVMDASSELKRASSGHYGIPGKQSRPPIRRGKEMGAQLFGHAEGMGLFAARSTTSKKRIPGENDAAQAITEAIRRTERPEDPAAQAVFDQLPRTAAAIAKLKTACGKDEQLKRLHGADRCLGVRKRQSLI